MATTHTTQKLTKSQHRSLDRLVEIGGVFMITRSVGRSRNPHLSGSLRTQYSHKGLHTVSLDGLVKHGLVTYTREGDWQNPGGEVDTYRLTNGAEQ
jgi:hypothetical protein